MTADTLTTQRPRPVERAAPDRAEHRHQPVILFENVAKSFAGRAGEPEVRALDGIDLAVAEGEIYGVIGPSGAGKSTLIRLVNGLERASAGRVTTAALDIGRLPPAELRRARRRIGMIFQHFNLLSSRTAYGNVALPLELDGKDGATIRARVEPLLELVGLADKRNRYPAELSGGQKQRVAIARALACEPQVLLSDEATSALDPETTRSILRLIKSINLKLGLTVLLITHEMHVIKEVCHRVAVLDHGRLVEEGPVSEVFAEPRSPVTRALVADAIGATLPAWLGAKLRPEPVPGGRIVMRVIFRGAAATDPLVSRLARELDIDVAILAGQVDELDGSPFGVLTIAGPGDPATIERMYRFFRLNALPIEVLGYVASDR